MKFTKEMREISGMGGSYEQCCRDMVIAGANWLKNNPDKNPEWKTFKNVFGLTTDENEDAKELENILLEASGDDCTGAMMQAAMSHVGFIKLNGWDKYVEQMKLDEK
jgi:hypothetical protein